MKKTLEPMDFMMMDVHRPRTDEEISQDAPQAVVDRTFPKEGSEDPTIEATPSKRCEFCFGPMPCTEHANVKAADISTINDVDVTAVLAGAYNYDLEEVVVIGRYKNSGGEYFASSRSDLKIIAYALMRALHKINKHVDNAQEAREEQ